MERQTITGRMSYQDLEGGFWGIISEGGDKFVPVDGLPDDFKKDGLAIRATIEAAHVLGTSMWGKHIRILDIHL